MPKPSEEPPSVERVPELVVCRDVGRFRAAVERFPSVILGTHERVSSENEPPEHEADEHTSTDATRPSARRASSLRARSLRVLAVGTDGALYFAVPRTRDADDDEPLASHVGYALGHHRSAYFSMRGTLEPLFDRTTLRELWKPGAHPDLDGPDDPKAMLLVLHPEEAELWQALGHVRTRFAFEPPDPLMVAFSRAASRLTARHRYGGTRRGSRPPGC